MNYAKMLLGKLGHFLLVIIGVLRRALCCFRRRRRMSDSSLPLTNRDVGGRRFATVDQNGGELQSWDSWGDGEAMSVQVDSNQSLMARTGTNRFDRLSFSEDRKSDDDVDELFKDMIPTIRRTKKYIVRSASQEENQTLNPSNRLAVDIKATSTVFNQSPELGTIDDHVETWEDVTESDELWDSETALREQKLAERERRLAEHQKRKQEREQERMMRSCANPTRLS